MSSGVATRPRGTRPSRAAAMSRLAYTASVMPVRTMPGDTAFTRIPSRPSSWDLDQHDHRGFGGTVGPQVRVRVAPGHGADGYHRAARGLERGVRRLGEQA